MTTELIRKATVEELAGHRARALELFDAAAALLARVNETAAKAAPGHSYGPTVRLSTSSRAYENTSREEFTKELDRSMWRSIMATTNFLALMDAQERKKFEEDLQKNPPPATAENITATCFRLLGDADAIFRRGLVNAFSRLARDYRSNDGFKLGPRIIVEYAFSVWSGSVGHIRKDDELGDIDRVMHVLDGKAYDRQGETSLIRCIWNDKGAQECETPYWRARWFQNGNLHLYFKNDELRARANRVIAEHFGQAVPAGHEARAAGRR